MAGTRAAIRYAKAVLSLANDQNVSDVINKDMKLIATTLSENAELDATLKNSVIKADDKKAVLSKVFSNINPLSTKLFDVLHANKRLDITAAVAQQYSILFDQQNGKEHATVTTAVPLTNDLEVKILAKIKELTNKTVALENIVDESILGGFILRLGDKEYNASIANKLNKLKREFTLN